MSISFRLYGLRVDSIILFVRTDESYVNDAIGEVDPHNDSILVSRDVEDHSTVLQDTGAADISFHVCGRSPVCPKNLLIPRQNRLASVAELGVTIKKFPEGS